LGRDLKDLNCLNGKRHKEFEMSYYHNCIGRSRPRRSQLGRIYHGSRVRGGHNSNSLIVLIDAISASQKLRLPPSLLEQMAEDRLIPHYRIGDQIRFDPIDLDKWLRCRRIDEVELDCEEVE
jgi:excisionase family DNA binding protein